MIGNIRLLETAVKHFRFDDEVITDLIRGKYQNSEIMLLAYVKRHLLNSDQIDELLQKEESFPLCEVLRRNVLSKSQQLLLVEKCNVMLLEAYFLPQGYFDCSRRLSDVAEYRLIAGFIKSKNETNVATEVLKAYVDNTSADLLTDEILKLIVANDDIWASRYILHKCRLKHDQEEFFVAHAPEDMIKGYISDKKLWSESAQIYLLEHNFPLAEYHYHLYGLRCNAQTIYHATRRKAYDERCAKKNEEVSPPDEDS